MFDHLAGRFRHGFRHFWPVGTYRSRGNDGHSSCWPDEQHGYYEIGNRINYGDYIPTRPTLFRPPPGKLRKVFIIIILFKSDFHVHSHL